MVLCSGQRSKKKSPFHTNSLCMPSRTCCKFSKYSAIISFLQLVEDGLHEEMQQRHEVMAFERAGNILWKLLYDPFAQQNRPHKTFIRFRLIFTSSCCWLRRRGPRMNSSHRSRCVWMHRSSPRTSSSIWCRRASLAITFKTRRRRTTRKPKKRDRN
jgi:hypothetical protein